MSQANSFVCICETREQALRAMYNLESAHIRRETLSTATRDIPSGADEANDYNIGAQTFVIPGIGPFLVSGPLASWMLKALDNEAGLGDVSVLGVIFANLGVPRARALTYEASLKAGGHLLILHGLSNAVADAVKVIGGTTSCFEASHTEEVFGTVLGADVGGKPATTSHA